MASGSPSDNEIQRLEWLRQSRLLDTAPEDTFDDLTRLAAQVCGVPIAAVSLIDDERQWFKSIVGLPISETTRDVAFCAHTILQTDVMVVSDATQDHRFKDNPLVTGQPDIRFYAGAPLVTSDGFALGSLCVIDVVPRQINADQTAVLAILARQVANRIEMQRRIAFQEEMVAEQARLTQEQTRLMDEQARLITERLRAEIACHESEERLRLALESGRLGSFDLDLHTGQYLDMSEIWRAQFAVPPAAIGYSADDWLQMIHPDDRARTSEAVEQALKGHQDYLAEYRVVHPDGSVRWISAHGTPLYDGAGEPLRIVGVTQDITTKKAEEAQRELALAEALERADRDPLTGLLNHRTFHRRLAEEADRALREGTQLAVAMLDIDGFGFFNKAYGHAVGDGVLLQVTWRLQTVCRAYDTAARYGGDEFVLLLPAVGVTTRAEVETRLRADLRGLTFHPQGQEVAVPITVCIGVSLFPYNAADRQEVLEQADERLRRAKTDGAAETEADAVRMSALASVSGFPMLDALVTAVDNKDRYTRRHSEDVMTYSLVIAREIGLDEATRQMVAVAALLHDVGKIGVSDAVLRKPGPLTDEELIAIQRHPQMGAAIVGAVTGLEETLDAVRHHHERWDGGGYPSGLRGEDTPLIARLMAVADAFSAMTMDRPYRQGMDRDKAINILQAGAGTQWDPECVSAFLLAQRRPDNGIVPHTDPMPLASDRD